ncbi:MAG: class I SAM-dependent methyltransferase [Flavobacterium sp.]
MKLSETELQELARQLRCPDEDEGLQVAEMMNVTNANIINKAITAINLQSGGVILEIGPGNGRYIADVISTAANIKYYGADISKAMVDACNAKHPSNENVEVLLTDGNSLPFQDNHFDKVLTVNTIYFWANPEEYTLEIARVMKPGALLCIGYIPERIMHKIPFAKYGFTLYDETSVRELLEKSGFAISNEFTETEMVASMSGQQIEREFVIITAIKK